MQKITIMLKLILSYLVTGVFALAILSFIIWMIKYGFSKNNDFDF